MSGLEGELADSEVDPRWRENSVAVDREGDLNPTSSASRPIFSRAAQSPIAGLNYDFPWKGIEMHVGIATGAQRPDGEYVERATWPLAGSADGDVVGASAVTTGARPR